MSTHNSDGRPTHRPSLLPDARHSISVVNSNDGASRRISQQHRSSVTGQPDMLRRMSQSVSTLMAFQTPSRRSSRQRPSVAGSSYYGSSHWHVGKVGYENTYRLTPNDWERFSPCRAQEIMEQVLQSYLDGESYDALKCANMSLHLSEIIKERIKSDLKNPPTNILDKAPKRRNEDGKLVSHIQPRYRVVCTVVIGQLTGQSVRYVSRCLWDSSADNYASASYQNSSLFATATVFAVYFE